MPLSSGVTQYVTQIDRVLDTNSHAELTRVRLKWVSCGFCSTDQVAVARQPVGGDRRQGCPSRWQCDAEGELGEESELRLQRQINAKRARSVHQLDPTARL